MTTHIMETSDYPVLRENEKDGIRRDIELAIGSWILETTNVGYEMPSLRSQHWLQSSSRSGPAQKWLVSPKHRTFRRYTKNWAVKIAAERCGLFPQNYLSDPRKYCSQTTRLPPGRPPRWRWRFGQQRPLHPQWSKVKERSTSS